MFYRGSRAELTPSEALAEGFSLGHTQDFPYWARQNRSLDNLGAQVSFTQQWGGGNLLKAGPQRISFPLQEYFRFAVTAATVVTDPADPLYPYTPAGGGRVFLFEASLRPTLTSAFVQNDLHLGTVNLDLGLRHDSYTVADISANLLQLRLGLSYRMDRTGTVLRASYDRLLVLREHENLSLSTLGCLTTITRPNGG